VHALLGLERFPVDDTIRNLFRKYGMGQIQRLYEPLAGWQMDRLPQRSEGYTLVAADSLQRMGYTGVVSLAGGWRAYLTAGLPAETQAGVRPAPREDASPRRGRQICPPGGRPLAPFRGSPVAHAYPQLALCAAVGRPFGTRIALPDYERQHGQSRVTGKPLAGRLRASGAGRLCPITNGSTVNHVLP